MEDDTIKALPPSELHLNPAKAYLVTGGASGFGIEIGKWLVEKGAKHLVLISRSGPKTEYDNYWIDQLKKSGINVMLENINLSSLSDVQASVKRITAVAPIGGLIHGAAVLQDSTIQNLDEKVFAKVFVPKAIGAWNLHVALENTPVDFFLSLSSISSVFGLPGQSNYSAANNFLDKLVAYRKLKGLHAQSVNLGVLGQYAGMSREGGNVLKVLENQGWLALSLKQITSKLERILLEGDTVRMAANIDWVRFRDFFGHLKSDQKFAHLLSDEALNLGGAKSGAESLKDKVKNLVSGEASAFLISNLKDALARILGTTADKLDETKSVSAIGLDSLMMNQLRNWIQQKLEISYPLMKMAKGPSIVELSGHLMEDIAKSGGSIAVSDTSGITSEEDIEVINNWFIHRKSDSTEAKRIKLFMFHSMGASASMFGHFIYNPPANCDVYCIQLPGRENRSNEPIYTDLQPLLNDLEQAMLPLLDGDFAIYGHSYGGIIAFEMTRRLRNKYQKEPLHFFSSATMAPQITLTWKNRDVMRESTISANSEQKLIGLMSYIDDLDFVKKILPLMRQDMPLLMGYDYQVEDKFDFPITVFSAIEDEVTLPEEMAEWKEQTNNTFRQELVHGDHWFISRNKDFIAAQITKDLESTLIEN
jgi:surfactin synthase thioesterase subunit/aryl carrier-like protein